MTKTSPPRPRSRSDPTSAAADGAARTSGLVDRRGRAMVVLAGHPLPFGVSETRLGLNFAVFSSHATAMKLVLFAPRETAPLLELPLDPAVHRTGRVWHVELQGVDPHTRYGWR